MRSINKRFGAKVLSIALSILLTSQYAFAAPVGKITYTEGRVDLLKPGSDMAAPLREGDEVSVGDAVRTKSNSKAEITFDDKSTVRLAQNSKVDIADYQLDENNRRKTANILVERGKARTIIAKMPDAAEFVISTPNAQGKVKGSDIFTTYQSGSSGMLVAEGQLAVSSIASPQSIVMVPAGSSISVPLDEIPKDPRAYLELEKKLYESDTNIPPRSKVEGGTIKGVIVKLSGDVRITKKGEASPHLAGINEILGEGDKVETGADGAIEIRFDNGNAMSLKPQSNVTIVTLVFNPQTGEYENLFESTAGRIKARIENLKGKSKFEVKTPTSICGARGTIMYMNILPNMTQSFFEGGNGYMTNVMSGMTKVVGIGENAFSDAGGNVSEPSNTPEGDRESFSEGWEPGSGVEGYSAPESSVSDYFDSTGGDTGGGADPDTGGDTGGDNFVEIPFNPGGTITPPSISLTATGSFVGDAASVLTATVASVDKAIPSPWIGIEPFTVTGAYTNPDNKTLWSTEVEGTGSAGGSVQGWFGGSWHSWEGALATLYIDPGGINKKTGAFSHIAGFMFGYFTGTNTGGDFTGNSFDDPKTKLIEGVVIVPVNTTTILPADLADAVTTQAITTGSAAYGAFDAGNGYVDVDLDRTHMFISGVLTEDGDSWGIWKDSYNGTYKNSNSIKEWSGVAGGGYANQGYHFTTIEGIDDMEGGLRIDMMGSYLSYHNLGSFLGTALGTYTAADNGNFSALGFGNYTETPLTSSGRFSSSLYDNGTSTGSLSGLIGTTAADKPMISIGTFTRNIAEPFIWFSDADKGIYTNNPDNETYTTYDGGAFVGITAGFGRDDKMTGRMKALYIDPDGNIGIFTSDLDGVYAASSGAYMITGDIKSEQVVENSGIAATDLYDSTFTTGGRGTISGSFTAGGALSADENFTTMSIVDNAAGKALNWGIYGQRFAGEFSGSTGAWTAKMGGADAIGAYYSESEEGFASDNGYWLADLTSGTWTADKKFTAKLLSADSTFLTYTKMGTLSGDLFGIYDTGGAAWQGVGFGEWKTDTLLNFTGKWGEAATTLYYNDGGYASPAGQDYGLIGSDVQDWWAREGGFPIYAIGSYGIDSEIESSRFIWNTSIDSYNAPKSNSTTIDGGAFSGYSAGIWNNEIMDGSVAAIYVSPETIEGATVYNAGILRGTIDGNYYPGILMWKAEGLLAPAQKAQNIGISSENLGNSIGNGVLYGSLAGAYENETESIGTISADIQKGSRSYFINDEANQVSQPWGIYSLKLGGSYLNSDPPATDWSAKIGGQGNFGYYYGASSSGNDAGYWLADIDGTWQNSEIRGALSRGKLITSTSVGSIEGDLWGVNRRDSPWIATSVGSYTQNPAAFISSLEEVTLYAPQMYDDGGSESYPTTYENGAISGLLGSDASLWSPEASYIFMGSYSLGSETPSVWQATVYSYDKTKETYTTYEQDAYYGVIGGAFFGDTLEGRIRALYVGDNGSAGYITSTDLTGALYPGINMFDASGTFEVTQENGVIGITPKDLYDSVWKNSGKGKLADSSGAIEGEDEFRALSIVDYKNKIAQNWGVYSQTITGTSSAPQASWLGTMGGNDAFGAYYYSYGEGGNFNNDNGYWIADLANGVWQGGRISADIRAGKFITYTNTGIMTGDILGATNENDGTWYAFGSGAWQGDPLALSGSWGGGGRDVDSIYYNYYYNTDGTGYYQGNLSTAGHDRGLIGSTVSDWWNTAAFPFIAMGSYSINDNMKEVPLIWNTEIESYNAPANNSTTLDGGAFYGYTAGIWNNEVMDGSVAAIYMDPNGNAGILRGTTDAGKSRYYPGISMWIAEGLLTPMLIPGAQNIGIGAQNLTNYIDDGEMGWDYRHINGTFKTEDAQAENKIEAELDRGNSYAYFINDRENHESQPWGIYNLRINGTSYSKPGDATEWSAKIGGDGYFGYYYYDSGNGWNGNSESGWWLADINGSWGQNEIRGALNGKYLTYTSLYSIEGDLRGVNNADNSTWLASSVGSWQKTESLTFTGNWGYSDYSDACVYSNHGGSAYDAGEDYGIIGSTAQYWWLESGFQVVAMGIYDYEDSAPYVWNTETSGANAKVFGGYTTLDDKGAYYGYTAGIWKDGSIDGMLLALYADENGNLGYLRGNSLTGRYYSGINMWEAEGLLATEVIEINTDIMPVSFNYTSSSMPRSKLSGRFGDAEAGFGGSIKGEQYSGNWYSVRVAEGEKEKSWGLVNLILGNGDTFNRPEEKTAWEANMGASENGFAWLTDLTGTWDGGKIKGNTVVGEGDYNFISDRSLGIIQAALYGIDNAEDNTWIAAALGTFKKYDAAFISPVSNAGVTTPTIINDYPQEVDNGLVTSAMLGSTDSLWDDGSPYLFIGSYSLYYPEESSVWAVSDFYSRNSKTNSNTTYDNGAYKGIAGGIFLNGVIEGRIAALYIEGSEGNYNAGYLLSTDMAGQMYPGLNMFKAKGSLTAHEVVQGIDIAPEDLYKSTSGDNGDGLLVGSFTDGGAIKATEGLVTMSIVNNETGQAQPWGIYGQKFIGEYSAPAENWSGLMGGYDPISVYYDENEEGFYGDYGYWAADITDGTFKDGRITAALSGSFITGTKMGDINGTILGVSNADEGVWQAIGAGAWEGAPLTLSGRWGQERTSIYYNDEGYMEPAGEDYGLIGSTTADWWTKTSFPFVAMGRYNISNTSDSYFWNTPINSYNAQEGDASTLDGGAFYGFTAGIWNNNKMDGAARAIYLTESGAAGILKGGVDGNYYPEISMWKAAGELMPEQLSSGLEINPADLGGYINPGAISNKGLYGYFTGSDFDEEDNYISGWQDYGYSYSIGKEPWGILDIKLGNENGYSNPAEDTKWTAVMGGVEKNQGGDLTACWFADLSGTWQNDEIRAGVTGASLSDGSLGTLEGSLYGASDTSSGTWAATIIGSYQDTPLSFDGLTQGNFGYYNNETNDIDLNYGSIKGLFGGIASPWTGSPLITVMGEFTNNEKYNLWGADLIGGADGDGAILGVIGGTTLNDSLKGLLHALYIRPVEGGYRAGYLLSSDITGTFYPGTLDMFRATGKITPYLDLPTSFLPGQLYDEENSAIESANFGGGVGGDVQGTIAGKSIRIMDQNWGLWKAGVGGSFTNTPSANWSANIGGVDIDAETEETVGYWLGTLIGTLWDGNELAAAAAGRSLSLRERQIFHGDVIGDYNDTAKTWEGLSLGAYTSEPLSHVSRISALINTPVQAQTTRNEGYYTYYDGIDLIEHYQYYYYADNKAGYSLDTNYSTGNKIEYYYYGDGRFRRGDYDAETDTWTYTTDTWSGKGNIEDLVSNPPKEGYQTSPIPPTSYNYLDLTEGNNFSSGLLGGVDAITWGTTSEAEFIGEYHPDADLSKPWIADVRSYNYNYEGSANQYATYDGGAYYGYLLGYSQQPAKGKLIALYVDPPDNLNVSRAGYLSGDFNGATYANINMLDLKGDLFAKQMTLDAGILPANLSGSLVSNSLFMSGSGSFSDGGQIRALATGESLSISEQNWGIWVAFMNGTYIEPAQMSSQNWSFALGGGSERGGYSLGTVAGDKWAAGELGGAFKGIALSNNDKTGKMQAMITTGSVNGQYIEVDPNLKTGTWNAASAGEWVEVTELLTPQQLGFDAADLDKFVSVPVTEVYSNILNNNNLAMNVSLYQNEFAKIWTALFSGTYPSAPFADGTLQFTNGKNDVVNLTNGTWADGQWTAKVGPDALGNNSVVGGNNITGQAAGTYTGTDSGTLTGAGAGTWTAPE